MSKKSSHWRHCLICGRRSRTIYPDRAVCCGVKMGPSPKPRGGRGAYGVARLRLDADVADILERVAADAEVSVSAVLREIFSGKDGAR